MSDEKEKLESAVEAAEAGNTSDDDKQGATPKGRRKKRLSIWRKLAYSAIILVFFFILAELSLAVLGVKPLRENFDVTFGMSPHENVFEQRGPRFVTRSNKTGYFQKQAFRVDKQDMKRVFCLGGSTTFGRPYTDRESYVGIFRKCLLEDPNQKWEVINCGGVGYASYRLSVLMEEIKEYSPDVIVLYTGHNEFLEERSFGKIKDRSQSLNFFLNIASYSRVASLFDFSSKRTKGRTTDPLLEKDVETILDKSVGPSEYHRDLELVDNVVAQYRQSLTEILNYTKSVDAKLILVEPADNLRFSPFKSEHGDVSSEVKDEIEQGLAAVRDLADDKLSNDLISRLTELLEKDPLYAETHFQLARVLLNNGQVDAAYDSFLAARENDVCPLRANQGLHHELQEFAKENDLPLIDYPSIIAKKRLEKNSDGIPGDQEFFDHVHPRTEIHGLLSGEILRQFHQEGLLDKPAFEKCFANVETELKRLEKVLNPIDHAMALSNLAQVLNWSGKYKESLVVAGNAYELAPNSAWIACQYGQLLEKNNKEDTAEEVYQNALKVDPDYALATFFLGALKLKNKDFTEAYRYAQLSEANLQPRDPPSLRADVQELLRLCEKGLQETGN